MPRNKKFIVALIIILLLTGSILYYYLLRSTGTEGDQGDEGGFFDGLFGGGLPDGGGTPPPSDLGEIPPGGDLPVSEEEKKKLVQLTKEPTIGATAKLNDTKVLYFKLGIGHLFEIPFDGEGGETRLSNLTIKDIVDAKWSYDKSYALITTLSTEETKNQWLRLSSTSTIESGNFQNSVLSASFSPTENKLASIIKTNGSYTLFISDPNGTRSKSIYSSRVPDFEVSWFDKNTLSLNTKTSVFAPGILQIIPSAGGTPTILSSGKFGFDVLWASDGSHFLASETAASGGKLALSLIERVSPELKDPNIKTLTVTTLVEKCIFSKKEKMVLFCALPRDISRESLPDAWWQGKVSFEDVLFKIDLANESATKILEGGGFDMNELFLSPNENYIFFINKKDGTLWSYLLL